MQQHKFRQGILVFLIFILLSPVFSQIKKDSIKLTPGDSLKVTFFTGTFDSLKFDKIHSIDTTLTYIHQYDPLEFRNKLYSTLTNIGLAQTNQVFTPSFGIGYSLQNTTFEHYICDNDEVKYYSQYQPYTEAFYVFGGQKEQNFEIIFSRELFKGFILGLDFGLNYSPGPDPSSTSPGPYLNDKSDDKRFYMTGQYYTQNKRYGIMANYLNNKLVMLENGGLEYDSVFTDDLETDRRVIPVNLMQAQNLVKQSGFYVEQYFNLLKPRNDSVRRKMDAGSIMYSFHYQRNKLVYQDDEQNYDFYFNHSPIIDSTATLDSAYQQRIRNQFKWTNVGYSDNLLSKIFQVEFGANYDLIKQLLPYDSVKTTYNQVIPFASISLDVLKIFRLNAFGSLVFGDYNGGDYVLNATLDQVLGKVDKNIGSLHFDFALTSETPAWYFQQYQSNYYTWSYNLDKETVMKIGGKYNFRQLSAGANFYTIGKFTYLNDSIRPTQLSDPATLLQLYVEGDWMIKYFGANGRIVYQATNQSAAIRVPDLTGTIDFYFKNYVFKKAALVQAGFQFSYFTSYFANAYMPALRSFYIQNDQKIGGFLVSDVYLTLGLKKARIFVKYAHWNSFIGATDYFSAPNYPIRDARLYIGVSWRFYN